MFKVGDKVKVREDEGLNKLWWGRTGTIAAASEKSEGYDYDWDVQLDGDEPGTAPLVTYARELELLQ